MDNQLIAIRDGEYLDAIKLAEKYLRNNPDDVGSHFTLAQAYEATGAAEKGLKHAVICLSALPDSFETLSIAARCASKAKHYDEAYTYAERALKDCRDPNLPSGLKLFFKALSYIPGLKSLRNTNESVVSAYTKQTQWLYEYVAWYEEQSPNKQRQQTH